MKIQELLPQYLYQHKTLSIPGLGVFELNPAVNIYETKEEGWPEDTITFKQDRNVVITEDFLKYLIQHTGKMKPLAISDLESFVSSGVQLLNIGKPFMLKGIGSVSKSAYGDLQFQQGSPVLDKLESAQPDQLKDRTLQQKENDELDFSHAERKSSKKAILVFAAVIALALIGWAIYLALPKHQLAETEAENITTDTSKAANNATVDTVTAKKDSVTTPAPVAVVTTDTTSFDLIIKHVDTKARADAFVAYQKSVKQRNITIVQKDSSNYQLVLHVTKNLSDTTFVIDSLKSYYGIKATLLKPSN